MTFAGEASPRAAAACGVDSPIPPPLMELGGWERKQHIRLAGRLSRAAVAVGAEAIAVGKRQLSVYIRGR